jgi:GTP-binding protein
MSHIVAIVGRPNVGKSTLFNRLIGGRDAIVHDEPGVTRDRHYGNVEWAGKAFTIIDTGGYVPRSTDLIETAIREQAQIAIEEANSVIFVVDGTQGVTTLDGEIADILRKAKKKTILAVNKIDNDRLEALGAEFFTLGLGDPFPISALGGRMIGDFLDLVAGDVSAEGEEGADENQLRLAIIGKPNVGKSSLVNALLGKTRSIVTPIPGTTRDSIDSILRYQKEQILLIDTAGLRRKSRVKESVEFYSTLRSLKAIERCDVAVLVVDVEQGVDRQDLRILENIAVLHRGIVIAANKWDLVEKDSQTAKAYEQQLQNILRIYDYAPIIFISALEKQRIYKLVDLAKEVFAEKRRRIPTNKLNNIMLKEIAATPPSAGSGKEIKIKYISQVKTNPPAIAFFVNEPDLVEDRYKRFLERKIREHFKFRGVPVSLYFRKK